ncbi:MAG: aspartate kinase [Endomicrobiales bacterium]|nr:aspartate kinase [Endomicrobiales bacterium]
MPLVVMKFGGSSVADAEKIKRVAGRVISKKRKGNKVVVVVSAPGDMTDDLVALAEGVTTDPDEREMDMLLATGEQVSIALLSMAIKEMGEDAISLTGPQAGIYADKTHTRARIVRIAPAKIYQELAKGKIVIVAGFQGINRNLDITTLGRGGSDLTAVAIAAATKAGTCEIYTDVEGVYTTDPRLVKNAKKIDYISYEEMLEMAGTGAQVMQGRSIEVGKKYGVDIHVCSTFSENTGTFITSEEKIRSRRPTMEKVAVAGVTYDKNQVKLSVIDVRDKPGVAARIFGRLAKGGINVDMIIQSAATERHNDISFTVARTDLKKALGILEKARRALGAKSIIYDDKVVKVSIVGVGMRSHPGVAAKMFATLAKAKVNIEMISTSEIKVSCIIKEHDLQRAVAALHRAYKLGDK